MSNILITSAGRRVSLVRFFQKELLLFVPDGKVFTTDLQPELSPACAVSDFYFKVGKVTDEDYIQSLLMICLNNKIKIIIPTIDTELQSLAKNKHIFSKHNIVVLVSDFDFVNICRDKRRTNIFFQQNEIAIPKAIDKFKPSFPLFIKPFDGSLSKDIFHVAKEEELTAYHLENPKLMFMEYINKDHHDEYTVDAYYDRQHLLKCVVPRKRIEVRGGEISKGLTVKNEIIELLNSRLKYINGAIGCLTIQVFFDYLNKDIIGIEINPRFGGGYPLSYLADANYPRFILQEYLLDEDIPYFQDWKENLLMLRYDHEIIVQL